MTRNLHGILRSLKHYSFSKNTQLGRIESTPLQLPPPYEYVQIDVEKNLHRYLRIGASDVSLIVIVGAWHGHEIDRLLQTYPQCRIICFEPNRDDFRVLLGKFSDDNRVTCLEYAVADSAGEKTFYASNVAGNGSLLPLKGASDEFSWVPPDAKVTDTYLVRTVALDTVDLLTKETKVDCLWIDAQGSELQILRGATRLLSVTQSLFLEVATTKTSYVGACKLAELWSHLGKRGFQIAALGTDPVNGMGNSLWLRSA